MGFVEMIDFYHVCLLFICLFVFLKNSEGWISKQQQMLKVGIFVCLFVCCYSNGIDLSIISFHFCPSTKEHGKESKRVWDSNRQDGQSLKAP